MPNIPNNTDWSATSAWIALAISIITPTISLLLNNIHQLKLKQLELQHETSTDYYKQCKETYENFITQASSHLYSLGGNQIDYERAYQKLFLYIPKVHWPVLRTLNKELKIHSKNKEATCPTYDLVIEILGDLLQKQQKQIPVGYSTAVGRIFQHFSQAFRKKRKSD